MNRRNRKKEAEKFFERAVESGLMNDIRNRLGPEVDEKIAAIVIEQSHSKCEELYNRVAILKNNLSEEKKNLLISEIRKIGEKHKMNDVMDKYFEEFIEKLMSMIKNN